MIHFKLLSPTATLPRRATDGSGGFDLYASEKGIIFPGERKFIATGVAHDLPDIVLSLDDSISVVQEFKLQGILLDRSGLGSKGIRLSFKGLVDFDYRGEIKLSVENTSQEPYSWEIGTRICQIAYIPMYVGPAEEVKELSETQRGDGGFGSTGK